MGARNFLDVKRVLEAKRDFLHEVVRLVRLADGREWPGPGFPPELPMQEVFNSGDALVAVYAGGDVQQTLRRALLRKRCEEWALRTPLHLLFITVSHSDPRRIHILFLELQSGATLRRSCASHE